MAKPNLTKTEPTRQTRRGKLARRPPEAAEAPLVPDMPTSPERDYGTALAVALVSLDDADRAMARARRQVIDRARLLIAHVEGALEEGEQ